MSLSVLMLGVLAVLPLGRDLRDEVLLRNGRKLHGRVLIESPKGVLLQRGGQRRWVDWRKGRSTKTIAKSMREVLAEYRKMGEHDLAGFRRLAEKGKEAGLVHESRLFWWLILFQKPANKEANLALGNKMRGGRWYTKGKAGLVRVDRSWDPEANQKKPWKLRSEHAEIVCGGSLAQAVYLLLELEYHYLFFYLLFQPDLMFKECLSTFRVRVRVYRNYDIFPKNGICGPFFSPSERTVNTFFRQGHPRKLHNVVPWALVHMVSVGSRSGRGVLPEWLNRGLGMYLGSAIKVLGTGRLEIDPVTVDADSVKNVAAMRKKKLEHGGVTV